MRINNAGRSTGTIRHVRGYAHVVACLRCAAKPPPGARFCPSCGAEQTGAAPREGRVEDALTWGRRAIAMALASSRKRYEAIARTTVGRALAVERLHEEAVVELRRAWQQRMLSARR